MESRQRLNLNVPFKEKDKAKEMGAIWDNENRIWYLESDSKGNFKEIPEEWLKEKITFKPKEGSYIYVDLVPETSWLQNLRKELTQKEWNSIRSDVYDKANNVCEACGGKGMRHPVEAHERWEYDIENRIQKIVNIEALCPSCHRVTHIGFAEAIGLYDAAVRHLKLVNRWDQDKAESHIDEAFSVWEARSNITWEVDMTWIIEIYGHLLTKETIGRFTAN